ncbi:MAG: tetratricopeptide repeat protein [Paludibacteraceae bacterium]
MRIIFKYCLVAFYMILLPYNHICANKQAVENYSKDSIQINKYIEEVKKIKTANIQDKKLTDKILGLLNKASILSQNINNWQLVCKINSLYADVYSKNNNTSIAMSYQFKNLGLLETEYKIKKDTLVEKYLADAYLSIGYSYLFLENYQKSKNYYDRTSRFLESSLIKNYPEIYNTRMIVLYNNIAAMHTMTHDYKSAAEYYKKALEVILKEDSDKPDIKNYEASVYNNLGIIAQKNDDQSAAFEYYKKANKLWEVGKDTANLARVYNNIGIYYIKVNKSQTAIGF